MIPITEKIYDRIRTIMDGWQDEDIYAVSFFVSANEAYEYGGFSNVSSFSVSYNAESDCPGAGKYDEERWNYAFWRQDEEPVIDPDEGGELTDLLFAWYAEKGLTNIGYEDRKNGYDKHFRYIGKGPVGHYELLTVASEVAARLQNEGYLEARFGRKLPIIVHGLEYAWYDIEATRKANPDGEAKPFLKAAKKLGMG